MGFSLTKTIHFGCPHDPTVSLHDRGRFTSTSTTTPRNPTAAPAAPAPPTAFHGPPVPPQTRDGRGQVDPGMSAQGGAPVRWRSVGEHNSNVTIGFMDVYGGYIELLIYYDLLWFINQLMTGEAPPCRAAC